MLVILVIRSTHAVDFNSIWQAMFSDSAIAKSVKLEPAKLAYVISDGLGPHFHKLLTQDLLESDSFFALEVDGTCNVAIKHQLDHHLRFWSDRSGRVVNAFYYAAMLGQATAEIMKQTIVDQFAIDGVKMKKLLMLSCDGPSVNTSLHNKLNDLVKKEHSEIVSLVCVQFILRTMQFRLCNGTSTSLLLIFIIGLNIHLSGKKSS